MVMKKVYIKDSKYNRNFQRDDLSEDELRLLPGRSNVNNRSTFQYWNRIQGITLDEILSDTNLTPEEYLNDSLWTNPLDVYTTDLNYHRFTNGNIFPRDFYTAGLEIFLLNAPVVLGFYRLLTIQSIIKGIEQNNRRFNREYIIQSKKISSSHFRLTYTPYPYKRIYSTGQECHFINGVFDANYLLHDIKEYSTKHIYCHQSIQNILHSLSIQELIDWEEKSGEIWVDGRILSIEMSLQDALRRSGIDISTENPNDRVYWISEDLVIDQRVALYSGEIYNAPHCLIETKWQVPKQRFKMLIESIGYLLRSFVGLNRVTDLAMRERESAAMRALEAQTMVLDMAIRTDKERRDLLMRLGHEIKNPLHSIINLINLAQNQKLDPDRKKYLDLAFHTSHRLSRLITSIMETDDLKVDIKLKSPKNFNIVPLIRDTWQHFELLNEGENIIWELNISKGSWWVFGEQDKFSQILFNLVSNAVKHTPDGSIRLFLKNSGNMIEVCISDTGSGISNDKLDRIFDLYYQDLPGNEGLGIGLSVVKSLVLAHGGKIWIESQLGKGTDVFFTFPCGQETLDKEVSSPVKDREYLSSVWYVDDEFTNRLVLNKNLERFVLSVKELTNGEECLSELEKEHPELLIIDLMMPGMNGFALLEKIRMRWNSSDFLICVLSARSSHEDIQKALELGADDYLCKPIIGFDLELRIRSLIQKNNSHSRQALFEQRCSAVHLSYREKDCCDFAIQGLTNSDIGLQLNISEATVKRHMYNAYNKIGCGNRSEMTLFLLD